VVLGLRAGVVYDFQVRAVAGAIKGPASAIVSVTGSSSSVTSIAAPTGFKAAPGPGAGQVTLSWNNPNNNLITKYQYRTTGKGGDATVWNDWGDIANSNRNTVRHVLKGLTPGTAIKVTVRAAAGVEFQGFTFGDEATAVTVTPPSCSPWRRGVRW